MESHGIEDDSDWLRGLPPCFIVPDYISCYDALYSFLTFRYEEAKRRAFKARGRQPRRTDQSLETRFMTVRPDVVWVEHSVSALSRSSTTSTRSSGYGGSDNGASMMSLQSERSRMTDSDSVSREEDDPTYSLYMTEAPLVDNRIHYRTVGNQALADVLAQAYHLTDISLHPPTSPWYNQGWRYVNTQKGVHILRRDTNRMNVYGIAGVGLVPKTPEYVYEIIRDPYYRFHYDKLLKTLEIVENVDHHTKVCQAHLEAKHCLMKQSRETVLVVADRAHNDSFVTAVTSTEHPSCPVKKNLPRTELQATGFLITPINVDGKLYTRLIYILQVDMKGLPAFVVDFVMKHQPLAVAYIRDNIVTKKDPTSMYLKSYDDSARTIVK